MSFFPHIDLFPSRLCISVEFFCGMQLSFDRWPVSFNVLLSFGHGSHFLPSPALYVSFGQLTHVLPSFNSLPAGQLFTIGNSHFV
jgi:hypothetical protein